MAATITVQPVEEPVTLAEGKERLKLFHTDDDARVTRLIVAARRTFETETNRSLVTRTYRLDLYCFPKGRGQIRLPMGRVSAVSSISYIDQDEAPVIVDAADYVVDLTPDVPTITPAWDASWPSMTPRPGGVSVTYVAGYGAAAAVPEDAKAGVLEILAHLYGDGDQSVEMPKVAKRVIDNFHIDQLA